MTANKRKNVKGSSISESYRVSNTNQLIKSSGYGYQHEGSLKKIAFKSGKLTKTGQKIFSDLPVELEKDFEAMFRRSKELNEPFTVERWESHLKSNTIDRMLYNFGLDPQELADITGTTVSDVLNPYNWTFSAKDGSSGAAIYIQWYIEYDYNNFNKFKVYKDDTLIYNS